MEVRKTGTSIKHLHMLGSPAVTPDFMSYRTEALEPEVYDIIHDILITLMGSIFFISDKNDYKSVSSAAVMHVRREEDDERMKQPSVTNDPLLKNTGQNHGHNQ